VGDGAAVGDAAEHVLRERVAAFGGTGGVIALGAEGEPALPFTTGAMHRGWRVGAGSAAVAIGPGRS
jgi:L-asparaginase / beta-aspartyl-peptidase